MRTTRLLVSALVLSLSLVACSDDDAPRAVQGAAVTAGTSPSAGAPAAASPSASPSPSPDPVSAPVRLTGDGIDTPEAVVAFGTPFAQAQPLLAAALGEPTQDTGVGPSFGDYGTCPGTQLRALEYGGGALYVLFGDVAADGGPLTMYSWALTDQGDAGSVPRASALVGDVTTFEFGVGTTVAALREGTATDTLEVREGDEVFGPSFTLADQSSGFYGQLTGTTDADTTTFVQGGEGCGE